MCNHSYKGISPGGQPLEVTVRNSIIDSVRPIPNELGLPYILPPLVDLQHNGSLGIAYNDLSTTPGRQLQQIANHLIRNGVGRVLATITTAPYEMLINSAGLLGQALDADDNLKTLFFGIFHEGVFISPQYGWRGGHNPEYIIPPDWNMFSLLNEASGRRVRMVNLAPEEPGAMEFIEKAVSRGIKVALGHCRPDTATINEAVRRGATAVTHFGNGASPEIHRFKNPFWGFLDNNKLALGLIGDGFHLPPELVRTALRVKGPNKCFMVSDASMHAGRSPGHYARTAGIGCIIETNGFMHIPEHDILAGAWYQLNHGVEFLVNEVGVSFIDAWRLCSEIPAKIIGIELPAFKPGSEATFVQAYFRNHRLQIEQSVFRGKEYLHSEKLATIEA